MWSLFLALFACSTTPAAHAASPAPGDWFYADAGDAIDWSSVRHVGADVVFRTIGPGLRSGPVRGAGWLACGAPTRATLAFEDGVLVDVHTVPETPCVEAGARAADWSSLPLDGLPLGEAVHALVVYDVPAEATCSSCS